ncbi:MAG: tRNA (adenosine(37)-N6)-threonylcarbamoyltransferase complex dimerization subunit type 1 TsaB [Gammaproteobacteria bacterium]|nr:tRNA (adenosine(37)-N6)-threonylcarbamoyltransferase complex dimerization subunit type 1 TsaB [Gammaproteobacteria bacterium]MCP5298737.1 tRNA (adenosine(37)-N6)-threonylcarbamoyltransferase complex dimerization subunit type 1 TsaB [Chromatiaceae bacterium]
MKLLAIDATEDACSAALWLDGEVTERFKIAPRRHSELILPMMDGLLRDAGLTLGGLDALAFACGPGAFTGLRIATSVTQGAAFGARLPVVPVSSLQALAQGVWMRYGEGAVLAAFDARMNEVYWGVYRVDDAGVMRAQTGDAVAAASDVVVPGGNDWCGAGSGWPAYRDDLAHSGVTRLYDDAVVHAGAVAGVAARLYDEGAVVPAEQALPVYLRNQVAWAKA